MKLDFRTKIILTLVITTVCITGNFEYKLPIVSYIISAVPFLLLLSKGKYKMCIKGIALLAISILLTTFFKEGKGMLSLMALILSGIVRRMLPGIMMGYYSITTSTMSDVVESLKRMKAPDEIVIPIAVMFRFFYSLQLDISYINDGMKMYGITLKNFLKEPIKYFEFKIVPLFMVASKTADDVSVSAMTRGLVVGQKRTSISSTKLRMMDYVVILLCIILFILFLRG